MTFYVAGGLERILRSRAGRCNAEGSNTKTSHTRRQDDSHQAEHVFEDIPVLGKLGSSTALSNNVQVPPRS